MVVHRRRRAQQDPWVLQVIDDLKLEVDASDVFRILGPYWAGKIMTL